jgi:hypothetical protein
LDFEWYFTISTSFDLAEELSRYSDVLLIGAPTVAYKMLSRGRHDVALVDSSTTLPYRLPRLNDLSSYVQAEVQRLPDFGKRFDAIFLDPPWYLSETMQWLSSASAVVRPGGMIQFILFPEDVRPEANAERAEILRQAGQLGAVKLAPSSVFYQTPVFEQRALRADQKDAPRVWRHGDVVTIDYVSNTDSAPTMPVANSFADDWWTYIVGTQVVKVRKNPTLSGDSEDLLAVTGCPDDTLPSVSRRDGRRAEIGLWTSRNRVLRVRDPRAVSEAVSYLARAGGRSGPDETRSGPRLSSDGFQRIVALLGL